MQLYTVSLCTLILLLYQEKHEQLWQNWVQHPPTTTLQLPRWPHAPPERPFSGSHLQTNIKVWKASLKRDQGPCGTLSSFICPCSQIAELLPGCQSVTIFQCRTLNTLGAAKKKGGTAEGLGGEVGSQ